MVCARRALGQVDLAPEAGVLGARDKHPPPQLGVGIVVKAAAQAPLRKESRHVQSIEQVVRLVGGMG
jgi:hypothetical protein